jgi:hypothetical protein
MVSLVCRMQACFSVADLPFIVEQPSSGGSEGVAPGERRLSL